MEIKTLNRRLSRLEQAYAAHDFDDVKKLINNGCFYDSLTENEKDQYAAYFDTDRVILEEIESAVHGNLHFRLTKRPKLSTSSQEYRTLLGEIEDIIYKE